MRADPKSAKMTVKPSASFCAYGIFDARKMLVILSPGKIPSNEIVAKADKGDAKSSPRCGRLSRNPIWILRRNKFEFLFLQMKINCAFLQYRKNASIFFIDVEFNHIGL
jgi:hypothetical protein